MRPVYHRAMWSLQCAFQAMRPSLGPDGLQNSIPEKYRKKSGRLLYQFAVVQYKGDWEWHEQQWRLKTYWRTNELCHLCFAARRKKHGKVYTLFGHAFQRRSAANTLLQSMPASPCPLVLVVGWHPQLIRFCAMHALSLGVYQTLTAEALLWMCAHSVFGQGSLDEQLLNGFLAFKAWASRLGLSCSGRPFSTKRLHVTNTDFPYLGYKAFNTRIVLAFVADPMPRTFHHVICFKYQKHSKKIYIASNVDVRICSVARRRRRRSVCMWPLLMLS